MIDNQQIDAVITWVDGNDEIHQDKKRKALSDSSNTKPSDLTTAYDSTRFIDNGELKYCILSIRKFAPWIRNIYLVTDNQRPDFLTSAFEHKYGITVVDHKEIFRGYDWALPTFNTRTIETALWRIPGLAPRFIYFNDDFVLTAPVLIEDFFTKNGVVLRGKWNNIQNYGKLRLALNRMVSFVAKKVLGITRSMHLLLQMKSASMAGFKQKYYRIPHVPYPVRKDVLEEYFKEHPDHFESNIKYKFRNVEQFSAIFLANHLEIADHQVHLKPAHDLVTVNGEIDWSFSIRNKIAKIKSGKTAFLCLQGFETISQSNQKRIIQTLDDLL